ncbi:MAG: alcohol dehydrogenase catalytic domain-containing protein [Oscillospiraceae bacterium]
MTLASICTKRPAHQTRLCRPRRLPGITVGHEMVGVVEEVGAAVTTVKPGDRVTVNVETFCGQCFFCKHGWVNNCTDPWRLGTGLPHRWGPGGICPGTLRRSGPEQNSRWGQRPAGPVCGRHPCHWLLGNPYFKNPSGGYGADHRRGAHRNLHIAVRAAPVSQADHRLRKRPSAPAVCAGALPPGADRGAGEGAGVCTAKQRPRRGRRGPGGGWDGRHLPWPGGAPGTNRRGYHSSGSGCDDHRNAALYRICAQARTQ